MKRVLALACLLWLWDDPAQAAHKNGDIRLVGGQKTSDGTVVILVSRKWRAVCDVGWTIQNSMVACRQLGYRGVRRHVLQSEFGEGRKVRIVTRFYCRGNEDRITDCPRSNRRHWRARRYCGKLFHSAGVSCKPHRTTPKAPTTTATRPTPTTATPLGLDPDITKYQMVIDNAMEAHRNSSTVITNRLVNDEEDNSEKSEEKVDEDKMMEEAKAKEKANKSDGSKKKNDALKIKANEVQHEEQNDTKAQETSVDEIKEEAQTKDEQKLTVTLHGGRHKKEGRVAVLVPGTNKWGVICGDQWSYFEGKVVCRQLGYGLVSSAYQTNHYGGQDKRKLYARVRCVGTENSIDECQLQKFRNEIKCSKPQSVAGVICTDNLPDLVPDPQKVQLTIRLEDKPLYYLQCAMEENCLAKEAYTIREKSSDWVLESRRLLRFSSFIHNKGTADFIPNVPKTSWEWHACHMHYHSMSVFAHYDILDLQGNQIAEGHKASFCLEDTACEPGINPRYSCQGYGDQGLSVNCSDNYYHDIDCQWIDITGMEYGTYVLKVAVNPEFKVSEITFDNNVITCDLVYTGTYAYATACELSPLHRGD